MQRPDTEDGLFHDGNPATGQKGTPITSAWLNALLTIATFFRGATEPPAAGVGDDGDFYICTTTRNMYGPKTAGEWGDPWVQGLPGPRGYRWYWDNGAPGAIVGQIDGDFYLDVDSSDVYSRAGGVWGQIGNIRGRSVLSGERDPLADDGLNGDFWINTATWTIYGPKAAGAWPVGQALRGPQGIQGAAGSAEAAFWADVLTIDTSGALAGYDVIYLGDTTAGVLELTAPTAVGNKGRMLYVENIGADGNDVNLNGLDEETLEGETAVAFADGIGMKFYSDGANWRRMKI